MDKPSGSLKNKLWGTSRVASYLDKSERTVRSYIYLGRLVPDLVLNRRSFFLAETVRQFKTHGLKQIKRGRPRKDRTE